MARSAPVIVPALFLVALAACGRNGEFLHAAHVTVTKGDCAPCHGPDAAAPRPALDADCAACHRQGRDASPQGGGRYTVGKGSRAPGEIRGGAGAKFPHAPHAAAGMSCVECHDASKWRGNRFVRPNADECSGCHSGTPRRGAGRSDGRGAGAAAGGTTAEKILV